MRQTLRLRHQPSPPSAAAEEMTNASFRGAFYTALFMLLLTSIGLVAAAVNTAQSIDHDVTLSTPWATLWQTHGTHVALLFVFGYTVLAWVFIIVWIHGYWPDGWIYKKRTKKRRPHRGGGGWEEGPPEGLVQGAYPMGMAGPIIAAQTTVGDPSQGVEDPFSPYPPR
jgi:hypothetical protein